MNVIKPQKKRPEPVSAGPNVTNPISRSPMIRAPKPLTRAKKPRTATPIGGALIAPTSCDQPWLASGAAAVHTVNGAPAPFAILPRQPPGTARCHRAPKDEHGATDHEHDRD